MTLDPATPAQPRTNTLTDLFVYPIKGLSGQRLEHVRVTERGIPFDRLIALAPRRGRSADVGAGPMSREAFSELYSLDTKERLAGVSTDLDPESGRLVIRVQQHVLLDCNLGTAAGVEAATSVLAGVLDLGQEDRPTLVRAPVHHNYGWPGIEHSANVWACHVVNLASVRDLESKIDQPVDPRRFRANVYVDLEEPWLERLWVGQTFTIGDVPLRCVQPSTRCVTTEVNPDTARRDIPIPRLLLQHYGHTELGVYANILGPGDLVCGMAVTWKSPARSDATHAPPASDDRA